MARNDEVVVIGLGRFGLALATTLVGMGHEVMGLDVDPRRVQAAMGQLTHVVQADSTDTEALRQLGAGDFGTAVVAIGTDVEASILTTYALVDLGVGRIWAKAISEAQGSILRRVGATRVVFPERDMGVRVAHTLSGRTVDYLEIDPNFVLIETTPPRELVGRALGKAEVRGRYGVTVVCVKHGGAQFTYATPETILEPGDLLVIAGEPARAEAFAALD